MTPQNSPTQQPSPELKRILGSVSRLRPLPTNVSRLLQALDDPRASVPIVSDLISLDQALTAYILRVANSAQLGYGSTCTSLTDAVMRLGFRQVKALVLSTTASGPMARRLNGYRLGSGELWQHSIAVAIRARWLSQAFSYPAPEEAYVAGLLHDMGKLLLDQFVLTDYFRIHETMRRKQTMHWQVEMEMFGIDHAGVGGLMAAQWSFPTTLSEAIKCHHSPVLAETQQKLAAIVNLANAFAEKDDRQLPSIEGSLVHPWSMNLFNLDTNSLARLGASMSKALAITDFSSLAPDI